MNLMSTHRGDGDGRGSALAAAARGRPTDAPAALRVALVDDHAVVRAGYRRLIESERDLEVVAEYANGESAVAGLTRDTSRDGASEADVDRIDVLVLDLSLPGLSGLDLLRRLLSRRPSLRVLVFTMHDTTAMVQQCLRLGAAGFVTKSSDPEVLIDAVRRVARGERAMSPDVAGADPGAAPPPHVQLSSRELDVLQRLVAGRSVEDIAQGMHLSPKTVANYQTEIRRKLGVGNAVELLHYARLHGLAAI